MKEKELTEISERMGEAVHNAWMEKRRKEKGWHSPEECPNMKEMEKPGWQGKVLPCSDCHPCMRPYKDLPENEKELDRLYPKLFLKILDGMGYEIQKKR